MKRISRLKKLLVVLCLLLFLCLVIIFIADIDTDGTRSATIENIHDNSTVSPDEFKRKYSEDLLEVQPYNGYRYVFSTYYFNASSKFYKHRETPSVEWVLVFISSLRTVTYLRAEDPSVPVEFRNTKLIFFIDAITFLSLWQEESIRKWSIEGFLHWIIVSHSANSFIRKDTNNIPEVVYEVWTPEFLKKKWASKIRNGANNFRFALYYEWLQRYSRFQEERLHGNFSSMMHNSLFVICDSSDVVFQRDPFAQDGGCFPLESEPFVVFTLESMKKSFGNEKYNRRWMSCYGNSVLSRLGKAEISCAGVILGNAMGILRYLISLLQEIENPHLLKCSMSLNVALDQANHNYILHIKHENYSYKKLKYPQEKKNCVFHGNYGDLALNEENSVVIPRTNLTYAIVHQYTSGRHPRIMKHMRALYGSKK
ncbi:uncharacterized protein TM35_000221810 [Trypanosoma theileri]|uniref:Uncharacterized protein n=1 Tax=Trypanosoma theileri TaxID=67003 RepID=A0A1X0NRQ3_9TRYP|nr:uncharacterized protein TM35_000221810 [Trypanosoma theileri]ORC87382.1 hypothetical protein TM35_000221810 [Trypanosoma theileri]